MKETALKREHQEGVLMQFDVNRLQELVNRGLLRSAHNKDGLHIYNYTEKVQYDRLWDEAPELVHCRGLILDDKGKVVARPFRKFFNLSEREYTTPEGPYEVWRKYDGSLGISYPADGEIRVATRGDFLSNQAIRATQMLHQKYDPKRLDPDVTYLWEIIYPENRIVVDYKGAEELRLLGGYVTETAEWVPPDERLGFPVAELIATCEPDESPLKWTTVGGYERENDEGVVLRWPNDFRLKVKQAEYLRLHRLVTGVSIKHIWEVLRDYGMAGIQDYLEAVPEEFADWVDSVSHEFMEEFTRIEAKCQAAMADVPMDATRKEQAAVITKQDYPHVLFAMLDNKPYAETIWKLVRPERNAAHVFRRADE